MRKPIGPLLGIVLLCGVLLAVAACSQSTVTSSAPTPTSTTTGTPTLAPVQCSTQFGSAYVTTLPDSTYSETTVFAQVPLPPETRSYDDDASGQRVRYLCSAGTTASVTTFMSQHLPPLGWQADEFLEDCGRAVLHIFDTHQCWENGTYRLFVGISSNSNWAIAYIDPAFPG